MRQVYTLWPTDGHAVPQRRIGRGGMPEWAGDPGPAAQSPPWTQQDWLFIGLTALPAAALGLIASRGLTPVNAAMICTLAVALSALAIFIYRRRIIALNQELAEARRWNDTLFQQGRISLWREDWSHSRDAVQELMARGVRDMQSHFAAHPEELRAIRRGVIIKDVNDFAALRAGVDDKRQLLGTLDKLLPDTDQTFVQWLVAFANGDSFYRSETHITMPGGQEVHKLFTAGLPRNRRDFHDILVSDLDITEYKATQSRLAQAEQDLARAVRVSTVGALTASIAHEVNSPLAAIVSSAEAALRWLGRDDPDLPEAREAIDNILAAAIRAKAVVEQTRAFLGNSSLSTTPQDMAAITRDSILLIERELRAYGVSVHVDAPDGLPLVMADRVNMQQVIVNLMLNGTQAMKDSPGPRDLTITLRPAEGHVRVKIRDSGPGIATGELQSIFQPFYSTRQGGMGMGLAICKACVEAHGGRIWACATPGQGAAFHFELPIAGS